MLSFNILLIFQVAQKIEEAVSKEVMKQLNDKRMSKKEKDERRVKWMVI